MLGVILRVLSEEAMHFPQHGEFALDIYYNLAKVFLLVWKDRVFPQRRLLGDCLQD